MVDQRAAAFVLNSTAVSYLVVRPPKSTVILGSRVLIGTNLLLVLCRQTMLVPHPESVLDGS